MSGEGQLWRVAPWRSLEGGYGGGRKEGGGQVVAKVADVEWVR